MLKKYQKQIRGYFTVKIFLKFKAVDTKYIMLAEFFENPFLIIIFPPLWYRFLKNWLKSVLSSLHL